MGEVTIKDLHPGMRVKLRHIRDMDTEYVAPKMHDWLDTVVTVKALVGGPWFTIQEDDCTGPERQDFHWHWLDDWVEYIVEECEEVPEVDGHELTNLLFG